MVKDGNNIRKGKWLLNDTFAENPAQEKSDTTTSKTLVTQLFFFDGTEMKMSWAMPANFAAGHTWDMLPLTKLISLMEQSRGTMLRELIMTEGKK